MSKVLKIFNFMLIMVMLVSFSTNSYALNMNLGNNILNDTSNNTNSIEEANTNNSENTNETINTSSENIITNSSENQFTTQVTVSTQELTLSNVLSICLLAVGVVLILLAIAILIKLKG